MAITGSITTKAVLMECSLWQSLTSYENLELAYKKARKRKSTRPDVIKFDKEKENNLLILQSELLLGSYRPRPLQTFIIREPKTRTIRKSDFRDRIIHHAVCNIIEPIFEKSFIYDSFANRKTKGSLNALDRFDHFKRKVSRNHTRTCYVLKADIKHYFEEVDHDILIDIIKTNIKDNNVIDLIRKILNNHSKGMPLGNLTSQFFAGVYLNELDQFVKHNLKVKYYIRYVDDFVILSKDKEALEQYQYKISLFLTERLKLELHPNKCKILNLNQGIPFLGFRLFKYHRLLKKTNIRTIKRRIKTEDSYDSLYDSAQGWLNYASHGNTYNLRKSISKDLESSFIGQISGTEIDRLRRGIIQ